MKFFLNYFILTFPLGTMYTFTIACKYVSFLSWHIQVLCRMPWESIYLLCGINGMTAAKQNIARINTAIYNRKNRYVCSYKSAQIYKQMYLWMLYPKEIYTPLVHRHIWIIRVSLSVCSVGNILQKIKMKTFNLH